VAKIPHVPLDDGPPEITSTVILKLTPSADYIVGYSPRQSDWTNWLIVG